jgi:hypothetical protein
MACTAVQRILRIRSQAGYDLVTLGNVADQPT